MKQNSNLKKLTDKSFILKLTVTKDEIQSEYQKNLKRIQANFETKGFRKGKAPLDVIEQQISPEKMFEEVASHLISHLYADQIKKNNLKPIIQPQVKFTSEKPDFNHDWEVEIASCELPEIKLNEKYLDEVKKINTDKKETDENKKMDEIIKVIIKNSQLNLPQILIDSDLQSHLSRTIQQLDQENINFEKFLKDQKLTFEEYKEKLKKNITDEWTMNLAIQKIALDNKLEVSQDEVKGILDKNPNLGQNINMIYYLLTQQKVFNFLKK